MADMNVVVENAAEVAEAVMEPVKKGFVDKAKEFAEDYGPVIGLAGVAGSVGYVAGKNHIIGKAIDGVKGLGRKIFGKKDEQPAQATVAPAAEAAPATVDVKPEETQK